MKEIINQIGNWVGNLFSSVYDTSHIKAKIVGTLVALILFPIIKKFILNPLLNKIKNTEKRYKWNKVVSYVFYFLLFFIVGSFWFEGFESIATFLGLVAGGVAIALKDPLSNIAGWLYIITRAPFKIGDRIQLGEHAGDVIDITMSNFTIMEMGNWVDADQNTGRLIHIPNGKIFMESLANYEKGFHFIWNEIPVLITFESNWEKAKMILQGIIKIKSEEFHFNASDMIKSASKQFMIRKTSLEPIVYTSVQESGVELTIRHLCKPRDRRDIEENIWESILKEFQKELDIDFAYPTVRRFMNKEENKTVVLKEKYSDKGNKNASQ